QDTNAACEGLAHLAVSSRGKTSCRTTLNHMASSSVVHLLRERAAELPGSRSYTFLAGGKETENLTFSQLDRRARAIGAHLQQQLGGQGERALLLYPAGVEYIC